MRNIRVEKRYLYVPLLSILLLVSLQALIIYSFSNNVVYRYSVAESIIFSLLLIVYWGSFILGPLLLIRFAYYFVQLLRRGCKKGVGIFSVKTLFNPFNLLLFPSLLNDDGLSYRRRCLVALILFFFFLSLSLYLVKIVPSA
mgnify:CR=1 FL=1